MKRKAVPGSEANASGVQVIARAAAILRCLKNESSGLSLGQIAERVELPRSTVQRIVAALQAEHLLISAASGRGIRLGPAITSLAQAGHIDIAEIFRPYLLDLSRATGETVDLAVMRGRRLIFIDQIPGSHRLRTVSFVGESFPLTNTANGKASLAQLDDEQVRRLLEPDFGEGRERELQRLLDDLAEIRKSGIALDVDEHTLGISAVGCALKDVNGDIYAISLPTPSARFAVDRERIIAALRKTRAQLDALPVVDAKAP